MPDDVKFQETRVEYSHPETPKIIQWAMKYSGGLIKNEKQMGYVLFGFVALAIIIALFLIFSGGEIIGNPKDIKILPAVL